MAEANLQLELITNALNKVKQNISTQSYYYLLWGWIVVAAGLVHFGINWFNLEQYSWIPWCGGMFIGFILNIRHGIKHRRESGRQSHLDRFMMHLWLVHGVAFILVVVISLLLKIQPTILTLFVAAIGTTVSGLLIRFKPLTMGGIFLVLGSFTAIYLTWTYVPLVNSVAVLIGYILPGYLLKNEK